MVIKAWIRMLRIPNLGILAFTQFLIYFKLINFYFPGEELNLNLRQFSLLVIAFACVTCSGYIINNIYDRQLDSRHELTSLIPKYFSLPFSWSLYSFFTFTGFAISCYLSFKTGFHYSILIYPFVAFGLWYYALKLKCSPLLGNILISIFTGLSIAIIPYAFWDSIYALRLLDYVQWSQLMYHFIMLIILAFLSNLAREIIKDIEDEEGDKAEACLSTAAYFGQQKCKQLALHILVAIFVINLSVCWFASNVQFVFYTIAFLILPLSVIIIQLIRSKVIKDFSRLSTMLKFYMLIGILFWTYIL
ncbi:MAG: UbiA family prenyltransferase [Saprospiraceae bacterium]|nr:UbiA family prenyltransferase [Saprospiraceae bacterium]MBK9722056.1 UbiA family prenyltransferase [Saprospiraceae bacterium]